MTETPPPCKETPPPTSRTAAIVVIGNEVLSGKVTDVNSPFLLRELYALGVQVRRVVTIPDVLETIAHEVREASRNHDFVFTSGGIGPTHDDLTIPGIAAAFDLPLESHPMLVKLATERYQEKITEATLRMTRLPVGTELVFGGHLIFPVTVVRNVYIFPGVPEYLRAKFETIKERFRDAPYHLIQIYTQQGESVLAAMLEQTLEQFPCIEIGSYPRFDTHEYKVMLTLESKELPLLEKARDYLLDLMLPEALVKVEVR